MKALFLHESDQRANFAEILAEARKYRLCLTLSHQYIDRIRVANPI